MNILRYKSWLACLGVLVFTLMAAPVVRAEDTTAESEMSQIVSEEDGLVDKLLKSTGLYGFFNATKIMEDKKAEEDLKILEELKQDIKNPATVTLTDARISLHKFVDTHGVKDNDDLTAEEVAAAEAAIRSGLTGPATPLAAKTVIENIKYGKIEKTEDGELIYKDDYKGLFPKGIGQFIMILVGCLLIYLAIAKDFEPLLLLPIGFGGILANIPLAGLTDEGGFLYIIYNTGVSNGLFPLIIFMGVGAMTDFGPLIANPKTALLGAAAQFGIFTTLLGAMYFGFTDVQAASIGIIGGADGPTSIFVTSKLAPELLGAIAVAAYSYMALVPVIQPPIMRLLTTKDERKIEMKQLRHVSKVEKIVFPLMVLGLCILLLPDACPLIGALMFGNLAKESGAVDRLSNCMQNELINIVTIFLGLSVGSKLSAEKFLTGDTIFILALGLCAFCVGTAAGLLLARIMNAFSKEKINPLIGSAGVSAVPMAARVANKVGLENNPHNFLLMHAMGPNVAGVIGSAVAAGILLSQLAK